MIHCSDYKILFGRIRNIIMCAWHTNICWLAVQISEKLQLGSNFSWHVVGSMIFEKCKKIFSKIFCRFHGYVVLRVHGFS